MTHGPRLAIALALLGGIPAGPSFGQTPLGTAFTYQGRLADAGTPANGPFDFQFILFDALTGGAQVGPIVTANDVAVTQGLFTVILDFGAVFGGNRRWLEIGVRPGASPGSYATLSPRQELTAGPGSLFSSTTPWAGVTNKPPGFADDVDNDTTYTQGAGISITGTVISVATGGITSAMILDSTVAASDLATNSVGSSEIAANAVGSSEIGGPEVPVYETLQFCGSTALTLSSTCTTLACGIALYLNCAGECVPTLPQICGNTLRGYLLSATIP